MSSIQNITPSVRLALTEKQLAAALGVSVSWLQHDRTDKRIVPFYRIGRNIRYNAARVIEALNASEEGGVRA